MVSATFCHSICAKVVDDIDLTGLIAFLDYLATKSGCDVKMILGIKRKAIKFEVCCIKSKKAMEAIRSKIIMMSGLRLAHCLSRGSGTFKVLWSLGGKLCLGRETFTGSPFCLDERKLRRHVLIVGSTGSGKSTTAKKMFRELETGRIVLDWHGEYVGLARTIDCVSLNKLKSMDKLDLMEAFSNSLKLSDAQYYLLLKVIQLLYSKKNEFGIRDIIFYLKSLEEVSRWIRESKYSLLRKLEMLTHREACAYSISDLNDMIEDGLILNLSPYTTDIAKRFVAHLVLSYLFVKSTKRELKRTYIFIEEAHNVVPKNNEVGIVDKITMEGRKYGLHVVAITQSPKVLNDNIIKNTYTKIIHTLREVEDAKYIANSIGAPELWRDFIDLDVGEAIIAQRRAVRVVIDKI